MGTPYAEVQMNVATLPAGLLNISVENVANASTQASFSALTTTLAYVIGSSGTADAVYVDNSVAELTIGGSTNMVSGFGWSIAVQRDIGIGRASVLSDATLNLQSELGSAQ